MSTVVVPAAEDKDIRSVVRCAMNGTQLCPTVASLRVGDHHVTTLLKPLEGCIVVIPVLNDTCERSTYLLNQLGNQEPCLEADQSCHYHSRHLASRSQHVKMSANRTSRSKYMHRDHWIDHVSLSAILISSNGYSRSL